MLSKSFDCVYAPVVIGGEQTNLGLQFFCSNISIINIIVAINGFELYFRIALSF